MRKGIVLTAIAFFVIVIGIIWGIATKSHFQNKVFQKQFNQLQGYDGDPVIQKFRDGGRNAVAFLAEQMKSKKSSIRIKAAGALRQMGTTFTGSDIGLSALCSALNQSDSETRSIAEGALGDLGTQAKEAVPSLIKCISEGTNINAVWALGRIGPDAKSALPILESKMKQETGRERVYAAGAVWKISNGNDEAKAVIKNALHDSDAHVRIDAKNVLTECPDMDIGS